MQIRKSTMSVAAPRAEQWPVITGRTGIGRAVTRVRHLAMSWTFGIIVFSLLFLTGQVLWVTLGRTGPFYDEGIYIAAGLRTIEGHGPSDYYLTWFAGSLAWPALAGIGYMLGGLEGARIVAVVCVSISLAATGFAAKNLFGGRAAVWTVISLSLSGPFAHLAHLAVYDVLALAGIGLAFWSVTELIKRDNRVWLVASAMALGIAIIAKYPIAICGLPVVALIAVTRGRRMFLDVGIFAFVTLATVIAMLQPWIWQLVVFVHWRVENNPAFGVTPEMVAFSSLYFSLVPLLLAPLSWLLVRRRIEAIILLGSLGIWPAYHILTVNSVGDYKHITFGFLFAYPLIGVGLATLWQRRFGAPVVLAMLVAIGSIGALQMTRLDHGWPDARPAANYLIAHAQPDDIILVNNAWPLATYLYADGLISAPNEVLDESAIRQGRAPANICDADWIVDEDGSYAWSEPVQAQIAACTNFTAVQVTSSLVTNLGTNLHFVSYEVPTTIWLNNDTAAEQAGRS